MKSFLFALALVAFVAVADARVCRGGAERQVWHHDGGTFKRQHDGTWVEHDGKNRPGTAFRQVHTEGTSVVIRSDERELEILLRDDLAGIKNKGEESFQKLYEGRWLQILDCTK